MVDSQAPLTFTSTISVGCVEILIIDDDVNEPEESFRVNLDSNDIQVVVGSFESAEVFIIDDDTPSSKQLNHTHASSVA